MSVWIDIAHAPKDRPVDLWGYDRDPDPKAGGILLPIALSLGRWVNCYFGRPSFVRKTEGGVIYTGALPEGWYQDLELNEREGADHTHLPWDKWHRHRRIWPTHYMEIPEGPR